MKHRLILAVLTASLSSFAQSGKTRNVDPPKLPVQIPTKNDPIYCPVTTGNNTAKLVNPDSHKLSIDDIPPLGGDGSFNLGIGRWVTQLNGAYVSHSHREPHLLWVIDQGAGGQRGKTIRRSMVIKPGTIIEIDIEPAGSKEKDVTPLGTVRLEQTDVPNFGEWLSKNGHEVCDPDYAWKVTTRGKGMALSGPLSTLSGKSGNNTKIRMVNMRVWSGTTSASPTKVYNFRSGCARFQICGRWNTCQVMAMPQHCETSGWVHSKN